MAPIQTAARVIPSPTTGRSALYGVVAFAALLGVYFGALTLVSGWDFTLSQFAEFWRYILPLAAGFGVQVAMFVRLREIVSAARGTTHMVAASGTTSTAAMISCCAHYLVNVAPFVGATGFVVLVAQFQVEIFWLGLLFNAAGIVYIGAKLFRARKDHAVGHV
jgi:Cu+-exporting ATPase